MSFISKNTGLYYEGQKDSSQDKDVPRRPSQNHIWDAVSEEWKLDRSKFEAAAKKKAAELLACANEIIGGQLLSRYSVGGIEHNYLLGLMAQLNSLTTSTSLAASNNENEAYTLLLTAYNTAVQTAPTALKIEYSKVVALWRTAGRNI